ncbi:hypothetical protein F3Y22_tig00112989pilonHSYRG00019 [Hibiscus syriacus]|uniref:CRM domain-containing protein n=1 Tax=Hibiscus syriacus TaxID=106335 RepID=A0A6A2WQT9_HIBSY|nr:hypothetical protein F3Y22_tig00112989pilonHSYRG00019 [Hibiscus syriacus]
MASSAKNYVPVGRRGIYQGVILNMHLHWKKHQTLKVVVKTFSLEEVKEIAAELARLTGGMDGLRAVRKYIPKLELDLELSTCSSCHVLKFANNTNPMQHVPNTDNLNVDFEKVSSLQLEGSNN